jgi:hypothetical protein
VERVIENQEDSVNAMGGGILEVAILQGLVLLDERMVSQVAELGIVG